MVDTRTRLLGAAAAVVREHGVRAMTLEAVAAEAGVSKGGLLYHFGSKDALVEAMIEGWFEEVHEGMTAHADHHPGATPGEAYVALTATMPAELDAAVLAGTAGSPELAELGRRRLREVHQRVRADAADPTLAAVVRLACDGLWLDRLFGMDVLDDDERPAVLARLADMARTATEGRADEVAAGST